MKLQPLLITAKDIIGGTPAEVATKAGLAALTLIWGNLQVIGLSLFGYFILLLLDAVFGAALASREKGAFEWSRFIFGPGKKLSLTAGMLLASAVVDSMIPNTGWIPDSPLFYGVAMFVSTTMLLDVGQKYGKLTGSKVVLWIEAKLGRFIKIEEKQD